MKKRIAELEARRLLLLERIDAQRHQLAWHLEQLRPRTQMSEWTRRAPQSAANHPLAWLTGLAGVLLLLKPRRLLTWLPWLAGGLTMVTRLTRLLRLISELRSLRSGFR